MNTKVRATKVSEDFVAGLAKTALQSLCMEDSFIPPALPDMVADAQVPMHHRCQVAAKVATFKFVYLNKDPILQNQIPSADQCPTLKIQVRLSKSRSHL